MLNSPGTVKKRILVVEDDESIRAVMQEGLKDGGYTVEVANTAEEAITKIKSFEPHLVLSDYDMPGYTGLEMLKELREQENYVTVIMVSGRTDNHIVVDALKSGADDYIKKPFRFNELLARVETSLKNNDLHRELLIANKRLQDMVDRDYLTGLYNMRSMYEKIDYELKRGKRFHRSVACVMLDMDYFKSVNDQNDHLFGSYVLKEMGQILKNSMREIDFAARYGGDEFLVVLTESHQKGVHIFCERLRETVESHTFVDGDSKINLTLSLGFSIVGEENEIDPNTDAKALVRQADHALYKAKNAGRNQTQCFDGNFN